MPTGRPWLCRGIANPVTVAAGKAMREAKVHRKGLGFYTLRHTFRTIADATLDFPAVRMIMGHADGSIDDTYREKISDDRLVKVTNFVRAWLFNKEGGAK
jgi:integrase